MLFTFTAILSMAVLPASALSDFALPQAELDELLRGQLSPLEETLPENAARELGEEGSDGVLSLLSLKPERLLSIALETLRAALAERRGLIVTLFGLILLTAAFRWLSGELISGSLAAQLTLIAASVTAALLFTPLLTLITQTTELLLELSTFLLALLPVYTGAAASAGLPATAAGYGALLLLFAQGLTALCTGLEPLLRGMLAFLTVGALAVSQPLVRSLAESLRALFIWALTLGCSFFVGLLSVQTLLSASGDAAGVKSVKFLIGSFVPVVGSALSDAYSAAKGCMLLVRSAAGGIGIAALALSVGPLLCRLALAVLLLRTGGALARALGAQGAGEMLSAFYSAAELLLALTAAVSLALLVALGVLLSVGGH